MASFPRPQSQSEQVGRLIIAAALVLFLPQLPLGNYLLYPFAILTTWFHEMGHGLTALLLGWQFDQRFGEQELGCVAPVEFADAPTLAHWVQQRLGRSVTCVPGTPGRPIRRVAWCSGGAQGYFESAMAAGADAFITGEMSEPQAHLARECGVAFLAAGHHATERYGAPAVAAHLAATLGLEHQFIDIDNPA